MPTLADHQSGQTTKMLLLGNSGAGKTGALASLVEAGYNLRIADLDNGLDVLVNLLKKANKPGLLGKVEFETITDPVRIIQGRPTPTVQAWIRLGKILTEWPGLGNITTWGTQDIFVLDSMTFAGKAAMRFVQNLNGRAADIPQIQDYRDAQDLLERLLGALYSDTIKCNVIIISHVREIAKMQNVLDSKGRQQRIEVEGTRQGFPETGTGQALSPTIGRYFNAVLLADIVGSGQSVRRVIRTVPHENVGLKSPVSLPPTLPLATGLADYFAAARNPLTKGTLQWPQTSQPSSPAPLIA